MARSPSLLYRAADLGLELPSAGSRFALIRACWSERPSYGAAADTEGAEAALPAFSFFFFHFSLFIGFVRKTHKRILVALGWYDYRIHRGIERFALEQHWHLSTGLERDHVIPWGWRGDGILAWLGVDDELARFVANAKKPTVDFSFRRPELKFPRVLEDHAHAAHLVADHFLARGFGHFIFYSSTGNWTYKERGQGFTEALQRAGRDCGWLRWHRSPAFRSGREQLERRRRWLAAELKRAPKPLAVFAANDEHALEVLDACEDTRLAVPEEVAIVGAENFLLAADALRTPISSVDTNLETMGYRGAQLLDDLMRGKPAPPAPIRVPAAGLVVRKSSDILAVNHKGVAASLRFMLEHIHEPINVEDLVRVAAMSRRALHQAFLDRLSRTPGQELQRIRIERAKQLLSSTQHKLDVVGNMCGYEGANSFCVAFSRLTGMTPNEYRKSVIR
jgi:LacI family transcriptional regulator, galactose operon repressor